MKSSLTSVASTVLVIGLLAVCVGPASAEPIVAVTVQNALISFDSATPGTVSGPVSVTGLVPGDTLVGIDRRPQVGPNNGVLYGVGVNSGSGRIYSLDLSTGAATLVSTLVADPADLMAPFPFTTIMGTDFGVDFNPVPDRLRVTSDTGQNLRINVDNGLTQLDVPLAYQAGDPNFGLSPVAVSVAYTNNFGGASSTALRGVDVARSPDLLILYTNPNGGLLQTLFGLPFDSSAGLTSTDISGLTGTPYSAAVTTGNTLSGFYAGGPSGVTLVGTIGGGVAVRGIAAPVGVPVPEPATMTLVGLGLARLLMKGRSRRKR